MPKVPVLICYWKPEDGMESKLHLFFDDTAEQNLTIDSIFTLGTGLVRMLEKIMHKHTNGKKRTVLGRVEVKERIIMKTALHGQAGDPKKPLSGTVVCISLKEGAYHQGPAALAAR